MSTHDLSNITFANPFDNSKVNCISMTCSKTIFGDGNFRFDGYIEFKNGNTTGLQKFQGDSFQDLAKQIDQFLTSLQP